MQDEHHCKGGWSLSEHTPAFTPQTCLQSSSLQRPQPVVLAAASLSRTLCPQEEKTLKSTHTAEARKPSTLSSCHCSFCTLVKVPSPTLRSHRPPILLGSGHSGTAGMPGAGYTFLYTKFSCCIKYPPVCILYIHIYGFMRMNVNKSTFISQETEWQESAVGSAALQLKWVGTIEIEWR